VEWESRRESWTPWHRAGGRKIVRWTAGGLGPAGADEEEESVVAGPEAKSGHRSLPRRSSPRPSAEEASEGVSVQTYSVKARLEQARVIVMLAAHAPIAGSRSRHSECCRRRWEEHEQLA
jgi:hypothetical protein